VLFALYTNERSSTTCSRKFFSTHPAAPGDTPAPPGPQPASATRLGAPGTVFAVPSFAERIIGIAPRTRPSLRPRQRVGISLGSATVITVAVIALTPATDTTAFQSALSTVAPIEAEIESSNEQTVSTPTIPPHSPTDPKWTLLAGGDTLLRRPTNADPFARIRPLLGSADLTVVNLETAITTGGTAEKKSFVFRAAPRFAQLISQAGIDAVSLANNHAGDYGTEAMFETSQHLLDNGVQPFGAGRNRAEALEPAVFQIRGTSVAIIGASQIIPAPSWVATADKPGIASAGRHIVDANTKAFLAAVTNAAAQYDVVIAFLHWGQEGVDCPTDIQRRLGRLTRDAGATAVIGAHPHVLQPLIPDRSDSFGDGVIAYSLGNFIWDPRSGKTGDTGVLQLDFDGKKLTGILFHPHRLDGNGWAASVTNDNARARINGGVARNCPGANGETAWTSDVPVTTAPVTSEAPATTAPATTAPVTTAPVETTTTAAVP
jgi:poly-gamma-glutamate capsule biosynthesis protein CapA/YwtB (metallophosphatase superfamily)